ncbi:hypothetical protein E2C01_063374 [Portunus trituberculatus]|uniref:Uncharacterized protein n=1 Tax=Portunus trituberculatus TaxID=210409 RepID=A0A5B7HHE9_PORTR|nr:hypothetical protein [Portunus trituberculatus]
MSPAGHTHLTPSLLPPVPPSRPSPATQQHAWVLRSCLHALPSLLPHLHEYSAHSHSNAVITIC